jgi:hypothetical protein
MQNESEIRLLALQRDHGDLVDELLAIAEELGLPVREPAAEVVAP